MIGAIAGDIIGSVFEWNPVKSKNFPLFQENAHFTDDTVLTCAIADYIMNEKNIIDCLKEYTRVYPRAGYGGNYFNWAMSDSRDPYNSWGNGSAMRVSPVGFAYDTLEKVLKEAKKTAEVTHNHPEGIKGAQATASAIFLARTGKKRSDIKSFIEDRFSYDLSRTIEDIRPGYSFDVSCQGSVPEAIVAFLESKNYEDAIRLSISLGGDSDTQGCITGGIAQAYYENVPKEILNYVFKKLDDRLAKIVRQFTENYGL